MLFCCSRNIRLNSTHCFILKVLNKQELQQIAFNHSSDLEFKNFMNLHKKYTTKPHYFLVYHTTLASDNPLRFRNILLERI